MKTTLAPITALIPSSAAHRKTALLLSGGLELNLKNSVQKMKLHSSHVRTKETCKLYHLYKQTKCIQYQLISRFKLLKMYSLKIRNSSFSFITVILFYNCEEKGKLQDYMRNYSPQNRGTSEAHKFISF